MCETQTAQAKAETALSKLIEKETGSFIDPRLLRLFIKAKWSRITTLAHSIHEQD